VPRGSFRRQTEIHPGHRAVSGGLARAAVFGMSDGLISNVSLVIGFSGSGVDASLVRLAGVAGAIAGAVSMASGEWISISAQNEMVSREVAVERNELVVNRRAEQAELATMYEGHGMEEATARQAAAEVMRSTDSALAVHAREEFGLDPDDLPSPMLAAALSLLCFLVGAILPVVPWMIGAGMGAKVGSVAIGVVVAGVLGWAIGRLGDRSSLLTVARQIAILLAACAVTYGIGQLLHVTVA
jgi:VIT1/CCC1 family predicted Fe2+/Mn2+ transporter